LSLLVPVYDGKKGDFKMTELHRLNTLPAWTKEELAETICLVGYTANVWERDMIKRLSLNIQWVVVLAG
jgi:hypothetical protein